MKTKWFVLAMVTVLMGVSISAIQVEAATLSDSATALLTDDGGDATEPPEAFPSMMVDEDDGGDESTGLELAE